jgi:hypothetical protein
VGRQYGVTLNEEDDRAAERADQSQRELKVANLGRPGRSSRSSSPPPCWRSSTRAAGAEGDQRPVAHGPRRSGRRSATSSADREQDRRGVTAAIPKIAEGVGHHAPAGRVRVRERVHEGRRLGQARHRRLAAEQVRRAEGVLALGRTGGAALGTGVAQRVRARSANAGRFAKAGRILGRSVGVAAAAVIAFEITKEVTKRRRLPDGVPGEVAPEIQISSTTPSVIGSATQRGQLVGTGRGGALTRAT